MRLLGLTCCLLLTLVCSPVLAQSETEAAKAAIVFELQMAKVTGSPLGKSLGLKDKMTQIPGDGPDASKIVRIFGASTAPKNMGDLQQLQMGGLPVQFFVRFEFEDEAGAQSMLKQAKNDNSGTIERNGITYYKAPEGDAPEGVMMYSPKSNVVEVGTEGFAFRTNDQPLTAGAKAAWAKTPNEAIRLSIDFNAAPELIGQIVSEGKNSAPPMAVAYLDLLKKMKDMSMSIDFTGKNLLTIKSTGTSNDDAEEIKEAADSILGLARIGGKEQAKQLQQMDPAGAKVMVALLDGMNAGVSGDSVVVNIPKPEGFEELVTKMANQFGAMFGMGAPMNDNF